jgi:hypothetical protein
MKTWEVWEADMCDDPQDDMYYGAAVVESYATEQAARDAVASYEEERKRQYRQEQDDDTETIGGKQYRCMDLKLISSKWVGDTLVDKYLYEPKTEYDYTRLWERFPERWINVTQGETK